MSNFITSVQRILLRAGIIFVLLGFVSTFGFVFWSKSIIHEATLSMESRVTTETATTTVENNFPVGVNVLAKKIAEDPQVELYVETFLSIDTTNSRRGRLIDRVLAQIAQFDWYQNLASSVSRILVIYPGERREEIVENIGDILKWDDTERKLFSTYIAQAEPVLAEGKFFPGRYVVPSDATPENVADLLYERFAEEILARYGVAVEAQVPLKDALTIASLLEREAYDFTDMRYISGIIWNRLFINMPLQLDASLQYARGSKVTEKLWWPKIVPKDKYIESPYNTYQNPGLPPTPIANPSVEAVVAALNPRETDCMFYFHDPKGVFYCTEDYEAHVAKLKAVYGRGR